MKSLPSMHILGITNFVGREQSFHPPFIILLLAKEAKYLCDMKFHNNGLLSLIVLIIHYIIFF